VISGLDAAWDETATRVASQRARGGQ